MPSVGQLCAQALLPAPAASSTSSYMKEAAQAGARGCGSSGVIIQIMPGNNMGDWGWLILKAPSNPNYGGCEDVMLTV